MCLFRLGKRGLLAITATLVMAVSYVDRQTLAAISPTVCLALGINDTNYGWLTSAFSIAYLAFAPIAGGIIDRVGCRVGLVVAVLAWSSVSALHAIAPSFAVLFLLRILLGMTEAPSFPGGAQAVRRALPVSQRSVGFGFLFTGSSIGGMIAAPLAIALLNHASWRFAFLGTAVVGLVWVPALTLVSGGTRARAALNRRDAGESRGGDAHESWRSLLLESRGASGRGSRRRVGSGDRIRAELVAQILGRGEASRSGGARSLHLAAPLVLRPRRGRLRRIGEPPGAAARACFAQGSGRRCNSPGTHRRDDSVRPRTVERGGRACGALVGGGGLFALLTGDMLSRALPWRVSTAGGMTAAAQSLAYVVANPLMGAAIPAFAPLLRASSSPSPSSSCQARRRGFSGPSRNRGRPERFTSAAARDPEKKDDLRAGRRGEHFVDQRQRLGNQRRERGPHARSFLIEHEQSFGRRNEAEMRDRSSPLHRMSSRRWAEARPSLHP